MHFHDLHMVSPSPWPFFISVSITSLILSLFYSMKNGFGNIKLIISLMNFFLIFFLWARDIVRESTFQGQHTLKVQKSIKLGMILFIISELMFFFSFFWSFFHFSFNPAIELGGIWPPKGIQAINPFHVPLLNSLILVSSGVTITSAHMHLINKNYTKCKIWTLISIILGLYFTLLQGLEYYTATFSFMDSSYGSIFFMATGFHGFHVLVGTMLIIYSFFRLSNFHFSSHRHLNFELACWYWHFVDFIWLFLFISIYWWGN